MSESRLVQFREAVRDDFRAMLPSIRAIETHFGPFNLDELKRFAVGVPAVRISIVGSAPTAQAPTREVDVNLHCAAFIVTKSSKDVAADVAALEIAESLTARLVCRPFTGFSEVPTGIKLENHYSGALAELSGAIALFSVDWHQVVRVGVNRARLVHDTPGGTAVTDAGISLNGSGMQPLSTDVPE